MIFKNLNRQINQKMSLSNQMSNYIDNIMDNYMNSISEKYSIDRLELQQLWSGELSRPSNVPVKKSEKGAPTLSVDTDDLSLERLMKCTRVELVGLCKSKGIKCGGKKDELIARLQELDAKPVAKQVTTKTVSNVEKKVESKTKPETKPKPLDILKTISNNIVPVHVRTNDFGNVVHPPTGLVFNTKTKRVIGHQEEDGSVSELCDEDIENCKKFKFQYDTPQNLDKKASLGGVKVQELEDDEDEVLDVEEEVLDVEEVEEEVEQVEDDEDVEEEVEEEEVEEDA